MKKNEYYPFVNLPLGYDYDALEPYIDEKTMMLHHNRHLQKYIDNLNAVLKKNPLLQRYSLCQLLNIRCNLPLGVKTEIMRNAGGVYNHRFYFENLSPQFTSSDEIAVLKKRIEKCFGSIEIFTEKFTAAAMSVFGSGYAWLVCCNEKEYCSENAGGLKIITSRNQDTPISCGLCPLLCIDVWEHAYYLLHYNDRKAYIENWFKIVLKS